MGSFSVWHWLIVLVIVLVLFGGAGKIPRLMRDMGQGINAFKKGLNEAKDDKVEHDEVAASDVTVAGSARQKDKAAS